MNYLVAQAFSQEWQYRDATQQELLWFKQVLQPILKNLSSNDLLDLKQNILKKLKTDKKLIEALNESLKNYTAGTEATWSLKTNKMVEILDGATAFVELEFARYIKSIQDDTELANYHIKTSEKDVTIIANTGPSIYGTSKGSFFKTVLINTYLVCLKKSYLSDINLDEEATSEWIDTTPNAHVTPLPDRLNPAEIKIDNTDFTKCTYFYKDDKTPQGLAFTHSGYAFGGYRNEPRYPYDPSKALYGKLEGPYDCSGFTGVLTLKTDQMTTADLWKLYQSQQEGYSKDPAWEESTIGKLLIKNYTAVKPNDIQPGDIWALRNFDTHIDPEMKGYGKGGHAALVVDSPDQDKKEVMTLGYNRNMPENEGFGKQAFSSYPKAGEGKRIFFFRVKSPSQETQQQPKSFLDCCCNIS